MPIARRIASVAIVVMILSTTLAPIAASEPAAAQDGDYLSSCDGPTMRLAMPFQCGSIDFNGDDIDESQTADAIEVDIHVGGQTTYESWESMDTVYQNYLTDTETLASLEARNAIVDAYQNGESATAAQAAGQKAINEYYATHQINLLETQAQHTARIDYLVNVSEQHSDINNRFLAPYSADHSNNDASITRVDWRRTATDNYTLANGTEYEYTTPYLHFEGTGGAYVDHEVTFNSRVQLENYQPSEQVIRFPNSGPNSGDHVDWRARISMMNAPAASLEAQDAYDYRYVAERLQEIENQSETIQNNYDSNVAEDIYSALDSGELDPADVRGAEGMVRYMSGDSDATEERFNYALRSTLNLASGDLNQTMTVEFGGATERVLNSTNDSVRYDYNSVNATYEGLLFASETPDGGFQKGVWYNVSNFNGTTTMVYNGGSDEATFWKGNFRITDIRDSEGNEVYSVDWQDPTYDTYNASAYVEALETAKTERKIIIEQTEDPDDGSLFGGIGWGSLPGGNLTGLAIIGVILLAVASFAMNQIPIVGRN
ncbi:hypothetical protein [Natrinema halophilum]|uniref:Envelope protein N-terminal domain-containing protein n=1 Tax=Natrinema halophilum TaxID=1699371 RepID=A0A7D5K8W8_9EURY|nr:hypothetical protein [Natrinema halophilum]QLG51083.1 hypothetical protein HYG82_20735 [Natrinema halophilum]